MAKKLREDFPYLSREAMNDINEHCKQTLFSEQIREFTARRLREEFPLLKQNPLEEIAWQCKQVVSSRLAIE